MYFVDAWYQSPPRVLLSPQSKAACSSSFFNYNYYIRVPLSLPSLSSRLSCSSSNPKIHPLALNDMGIQESNSQLRKQNADAEYGGETEIILD